MADKLQGEQGEHARELWIAKGKQAFEPDPGDTQGDQIEVFSSSSLIHHNRVSAERLRARSDAR